MASSSDDLPTARGDNPARSRPKETTMQFAVEIPGRFTSRLATTSETAHSGPVSEDAVPAGSTRDPASPTPPVSATDAVPAGEAESRGALRAVAPSDEAAGRADPATRGACTRQSGSSARDT
jgi:hypothetical protein